MKQPILKMMSEAEEKKLKTNVSTHSDFHLVTGGIETLNPIKVFESGDYTNNTSKTVARLTDSIGRRKR